MLRNHKWEFALMGGVLLLTVLFYAGCGKRMMPTAPGGTSPAVRIVSLKQSDSDSASAVSVRILAEDGGVVELNGNKLHIPGYALPADTTITMICPNPNKAMVILHPNKLIFLRPVSLTLSYAQGDSLDEGAKLAIYWLNPDNLNWEFVGGENDEVNEEVTADIWHFSRYALAESY